MNDNSPIPDDRSPAESTQPAAPAKPRYSWKLHYTIAGTGAVLLGGYALLTGMSRNDVLWALTIGAFVGEIVGWIANRVRAKSR